MPNRGSAESTTYWQNSAALASNVTELRSTVRLLLNLLLLRAVVLRLLALRISDTVSGNGFGILDHIFVVVR